MPVRSLSAHPATLIGTAVLLFAAITMLGWIAGTRALIQVAAGPVMVFNTALCFALLALAVILDDPDSRRKARVQQWLGGSVIIVAGTAPVEHQYRPRLAGAAPVVRRRQPLPGAHVAPYRLVIPVLRHGAAADAPCTRLPQGLLVQILTALPAVTAVAALVGLMLELRFVYPDYLFGQMAAPTAISFIAISIALWLRWRGMTWYRSRSILKNEDQRDCLAAAGCDLGQGYPYGRAVPVAEFGALLKT